MTMAVSLRGSSRALSPVASPQVDRVRAPTLPREFYARSTVKALAFVTLSLSLWLVPGALGTWLARDARLPTWALVLTLVPLCFIASHGLHLLGWVGHEGFHFNLFRGRLASAIVGVVVSSALVVFFQTGVAIEHLNHHRFANTARDPDLSLFTRQSSFWSRLLLTRSRANRAFFCNAWRLIRGQPLEMQERGLPLPRSTYEQLARLNLACCLLWLCGYVALAVHDPLRATCSVIVPLLLANLATGLRPYLEHTNTDAGLLSCARSRSHWLLVSCYFGNSLHLEHHLYPSVPCYRLPRVHRWLLQRGVLSASHPGFEHAILAGYRWSCAPHEYGRPDRRP